MVMTDQGKTEKKKNAPKLSEMKEPWQANSIKFQELNPDKEGKRDIFGYRNLNGSAWIIW